MLKFLKKKGINSEQFFTAIILIACFLLYNIPRVWNAEAVIFSSIISIVCLGGFLLTFKWEKEHELLGAFLAGMITFALYGAKIIIPVMIYLRDGKVI